jgi:hypothetical protein
MAVNNVSINNIGIGWDIGIKNLSYCILEPKKIDTHTHSINKVDNYLKFNDTYYEIKNWKDISLVSQIESNLQETGEVSLINTTLKCAQPKNDKLNAPKCGNNAFFCHEQVNADGTYNGFCKLHFKKSGISRMPELSVKKCYIENCGGKCSQVLRNHIYTGYCKKHITEFIKNDNKQSTDFLKINRAKTTSKIDINHLGIALFQELDKIKTTILEPNIILLENQPVLKNPTMKSMQMFLYSYFLIRHMENGGLCDRNLQCYTASKKLDLIKFFPENEQVRINTILEQIKSGYQKNKKMSIMMVEYLLKNNKQWLDFFNKNPKQDDLADSLLMTLHYFEKNNLVKLKNNLAKQNKTIQYEQDNDKQDTKMNSTKMNSTKMNSTRKKADGKVKVDRKVKVDGKVVVKDELDGILEELLE